MSHFVHSAALCESNRIGDGSRIWAFAHILPNAVIGRDCNICDHVFIENDVVLGDRVTVKCGVQLWDGLRIEDDVFIGPNATFTNDPFPRSRLRPAHFEMTYLRQGCSIGANATILPSVTIGRKAMVGAGSVVTKSIPPNAVVHGNPARIQGYCSSMLTENEVEATGASAAAVTPAQVEGVSLYRIPAFEDIRGSLIAAEISQHLPFSPVRFFVVHNVPSGEVRGEHAHRQCDQFLICVTGSVRVLVDDARNRQEFLLNSPEVGLLLPAGIWGTQYKYSANASLLVFASHKYDQSDYIRDYEEWLKSRTGPSSDS